MSVEQARLQIAAAQSALALAAQALDAPSDSVTRVPAGGNLAAALARGGIIQLEDGATYEGHFVLAKPDTVLRGAGEIRGQTGAALTIPPGTRHVSVIGVRMRTGAGVDAVLQVGANDVSQTRLEDVPEQIVLRDLVIPEHRGKRGISLHAADVLIEGCTIENVWDPAGQDSQAIYILNTPGGIGIGSCSLSAGSEVILVGGDLPAIRDLVPEDLTVEGSTLYRPLSWQTDGVPRKVKNIFELKSGRNVTVRGCRLAGCWAQGQEGEAFTLTPALSGGKSTPILPSGDVRNVLLEGNVIEDVGGGVAVLGRAYNAYTAFRLDNVTVRDNEFRISRAKFGGRGQFLTAGNGPLTIRLEGNRVTCDGSSSIYTYLGTVANADGSTRVGDKIHRLEVVGNSIEKPGAYGFNFAGHANARNWEAGVEQLVVAENTFRGQVLMRAVLPDNVYLAA